MLKSESVTQEWSLAAAERGSLVDVVDVRAEDPETLLVHGIRPGVRLAVDGDAPFGGPRIVRIGGRRVAIDRRLTLAIRVTPADTSAGAGPAAHRR